RSHETCANPSFGPKEMLPLAVATSIDALAIGVSFAFLKVNILTAASLIAGTTFVIAIIGVEVGTIFGAKYKAKAEFVGGLVLIAIGLKVLISHLIG
ncbi:MAG: manganese efflux pump, partial [Anaerovoracaceae bacterium]